MTTVFPTRPDRVKRLVYVSERLVNEILLARAPRRLPGISRLELPVVGGSVEIETGEGSPPTLARLIRHATKAAKPSSSLQEPGRFFRVVMPLKWAELHVFVPRLKVAWFSGFDNAETPKTFVALCGSLANFRDWRPDTQRNSEGWWPSSAQGMSEVLKAWQHEDPGTAREAAKAEEPNRWLFTAGRIHTTLGTDWWIDHGEVEILFECYFRCDVRTVEVSTADYPDTVVEALFGAPVWVGVR